MASTGLVLLQRCAANFGPPPRRVSWWARMTRVRIDRPEWLYEHPDDALEQLFLNLKSLLNEGIVTWGHVVQANSELHAPGKGGQPGEIVFSLADPAEISIEQLEAVARGLFALKGEQHGDPDLQKIGDYLANEYVRVYGWKVPKKISPRLPCLISTTFFPRNHLPGGVLNSNLLPIVVHPREPHYVLPLPMQYWPEEMVAAWGS